MTFEPLQWFKRFVAQDFDAVLTDIGPQRLQSEGLFALEEVVEAAGVDIGVGEEVGHTGSGESSFPEEVAGGVDEAVAGGECWGHGEKVLDRVSIRGFT